MGEGIGVEKQKAAGKGSRFTINSYRTPHGMTLRARTA
jgi:hypothetical protein